MIIKYCTHWNFNETGPCNENAYIPGSSHLIETSCCYVRWLANLPSRDDHFTLHNQRPDSRILIGEIAD